MLNFNEILKDFEKIATEIKATQESIEQQDFVCRLVICIETVEREKHQQENELLKHYENELNKIDFNYRVKENKYIYLLNKREFPTETDFQKTREQFLTKKGKILTINFNNLVKNRNLLDLALKVLKGNRETTETPKKEQETTKK